MTEKQGVSQRNQMLEVSKLIASFFVVCIHVPFPGDFGKAVTCLGRFAVPMFFAISGFFSYRADCGKLKKRIWHIVKLNVVAVAIQIAWGFCAVILYGGNIAAWFQSLRIGWQDLLKWLVLNVNPYGGHLWYLASIFVCYVFLWGYVRRYGSKEVTYRPLYILCVCLTAGHFLLGEFSGVLGIHAAYEIPRSAAFLGLPMFGLGLFLRQYGEAIMKKLGLNAWKMLCFLVLFAVTSLVERGCFPGAELYLGTVGVVVMLMLFSVRHPKPFSGLAGRIVAKFGDYSTVIYLVHLAVQEYYMGMWQHSIYLQWGNMEAVWRPLIIIGVSLLIAVGAECAGRALGCLKMKI